MIALLTVVLYLAAAATLAMGFGLLYAYRDTRRRGLLMLALVYLAAGALSMIAVTWWPIIAGFILAVVIRRLRIDLHGPASRRPSSPAQPSEVVALEAQRSEGDPSAK